VFPTGHGGVEYFETGEMQFFARQTVMELGLKLCLDPVVYDGGFVLYID